VHHAVVVFVRVGVEEDTIDDTEDGGGGANAKHQRENGGDYEAGRLAKLAKGEAHVLQQGPHGMGLRE
jgi:hypothetical protein